MYKCTASDDGIIPILDSNRMSFYEFVKNNKNKNKNNIPAGSIHLAELIRIWKGKIIYEVKIGHDRVIKKKQFDYVIHQKW